MQPQKTTLTFTSLHFNLMKRLADWMENHWERVCVCKRRAFESLCFFRSNGAKLTSTLWNSTRKFDRNIFHMRRKHTEFTIYSEKNLIIFGLCSILYVCSESMRETDWHTLMVVLAFMHIIHTLILCYPNVATPSGWTPNARISQKKSEFKADVLWNLRNFFAFLSNFHNKNWLVEF